MSRLFRNPTLRTMHTIRITRMALAAVVAALHVHSAMASDLLEVFASAKQRDPGFRASERMVAAGQTQRVQSRALWNPSVLLDLFGGAKGMDSATKGAQFYSRDMGGTKYEGSTFNTSIYLGASGRAAITALAPLVDEERSAQARQLGLSADIADTAHELAEQFLAQSVAERYLDVLAGQHTLTLITQHETAIARADEELNKRRRLGDVSAINVTESRERLEALRSQRVLAEQQLQVARLALQDLSGSATPLMPPAFARGWAPLSEGPLDRYIDTMRVGHPRLKIMDLQHRIALAEAEKYGPGQRAAKVNAVAQAGVDFTHGSGDYGNATALNTHQYVGIQVTVPLSTGGWRSAKQSEALIAAERVMLERARAALELEQDLRAAWFGLAAARGRITALQATLDASRTRLTQTRRAHAEGARSTLELLGAEAAAIDAEHHLFFERLNAARYFARVMAASGTLHEEQLQQIRTYLF